MVITRMDSVDVFLVGKAPNANCVTTNVRWLIAMDKALASMANVDAQKDTLDPIVNKVHHSIYILIIH